MKKKLIFIFILGLGLIGSPVQGREETGTDFSLLLKGEKIISPRQSFDSGKSEFNPGFAEFLNHLGEFLQDNQQLNVEIGGHTDNRGTPAINEKLSLSRALQVKEYLVRKSGINQDRLITKGYADRFPIADNTTPEGSAINRRIEITALIDVNPAGKLTYIRRDVFTKLPDKIDFTRAIINQDLFHLYRVLTRKESNANVTFLDLSRINLGPQSLMIMYSLLERDRRMPRKQNVQLLTGGLRTKLNQLKGKLQVETPSCVVNSNSVEILVGIDNKKMSALSVFDGNSHVKASGKTVEVPEGFGTTVEMGKAPAPPQPLPRAPRLINPLESISYLPGEPGTEHASITFQWQGIDIGDRYHLQVARDAQFEKIIEDLVIPEPSVELRFSSGTYYWRAAVINKQGIEGYSAQSVFTMTKERPELPLKITPKIGDIVETAQRKYPVYGKTIPGTRILIQDRQFLADNQGEFSGTISLLRDWNHIAVKALHPDFKDKVFRLTFYRPELCKPRTTLALRFDNALTSDNYDKTYTFQLGRTFCSGSHVESELSFGLAGLSWKDFPGDYKKMVAAFPFTAALRFMPLNARVKPFFSTGLTAYLAFPRKRSADTIDTLFLFSPEIGGGLYFPIFNTRAGVEVKYTPLFKKHPFFPGIEHRIAFILRIM